MIGNLFHIPSYIKVPQLLNLHSHLDIKWLKSGMLFWLFVSEATVSLYWNTRWGWIMRSLQANIIRLKGRGFAHCCRNVQTSVWITGSYRLVGLYRLCYLRSVSEILLWSKSSSLSTKSTWCSLSESTFPPDPFLSPWHLPSLLPLLPPSIPSSPPSSSCTSPNCSSSSRDWLLERNWLKMEIEAKTAAHAKQKEKQTKHETCQQEKAKQRQNREHSAAKIKSLWKQIWNVDSLQSVMQMELIVF